MADKWRVVTLGDVADLVRGVSYRPSDLLADGAEGIPLLRATNIKNQALELADVLFVPPALVRDHQRLRRFDVVIAMSSGSRDAVGRLAQLRRDWVGCVGAFCGVVRADPKRVHPEYLGYVLQSPAFRTHVETRAVGTAIMNLSRDRILGFTLRLPDLPEQSAIAHILGTLDDKIELNRKQNETLEAMARALFKAWFVDFEPVRAKMEGRWQRGQSLPGLPAHLYELFPDRLVESELGEIPEGWEVTSLAEFSSLNPETWTRSTRPKQIHYVDLSNTKWGRIESVANYDADNAPSRAQRVLRPLDTIVGTVRPGNGSYAMISDEGLTGSTGFAVLRPVQREFAELIYLAATSRENIERLSNLADGGAYPAVRPEVVSATPVPRAGKELINEFSRQVRPMLSGITDNEHVSRTLAELRDTLLPRLISGELRVSKLDIQGVCDD
ncbi:restriction endonuclease subunit S [Tepidiphilus margaritifer]|jgi:type I restriction enzyme S subunit|uniref:restriction endonuclease subunit S n=1 Tax=Tepidiphilus margaritifer TaxID=203471 RepID=UPI000688F15F|nr:restriction endonuclease subunit S [Tepidiphilus margaritifer]